MKAEDNKSDDPAAAICAAYNEVAAQFDRAPLAYEDCPDIWRRAAALAAKLAVGATAYVQAQFDAHEGKTTPHHLVAADAGQRCTEFIAQQDTLAVEGFQRGNRELEGFLSRCSDVSAANALLDPRLTFDALFRIAKAVALHLADTEIQSILREYAGLALVEIRRSARPLELAATMAGMPQDALRKLITDAATQPGAYCQEKGQYSP